MLSRHRVKRTLVVDALVKSENVNYQRLFLERCLSREDCRRVLVNFVENELRLVENVGCLHRLLVAARAYVEERRFRVLGG